MSVIVRILAALSLALLVLLPVSGVPVVAQTADAPAADTAAIVAPLPDIRKGRPRGAPDS